MRRVFPQLVVAPDLNRGEQRLAAEVALARLRGDWTPPETFHRAVATLKAMAHG